jgi:Dolichyl-phosphate-mannose-protein mannosyltransferase
VAAPPEASSTEPVSPSLGRRCGAGVGVVLALFVWLVWPGLRENTPTVDEFAHVPAGYAYWQGAPLDVYQNSPPLTRLLVAAPLAFIEPSPQIDLGLAEGARGSKKAWLLAREFMESNRARYFECFFRARLVVLGLAVLEALVLFAWSSHWFGPRGGLFSVFLYCLSPEVLAHGGLATTDLALSLFFLTALFFWSLFLEGPRLRLLLATALACAAASLTKYSGPILIPLFVLVAALAAPRGRRLIAGAAGAMTASATLGLALLALYGPGQFPTRLRELPCFSQLGRQAAGSALGMVALPLPRAYVAGFDAQLKDAEATASYLFGEWGPGRRYYYLVALAVKTPIPILAFLVAPWLLRRSSGTTAKRHPVVATVLVPAAVYLASVSASSLQVGVRYVFPAYVVALVSAGAVPAIVSSYRNARGRLAFGLLCGWLLVAVVGARPHFLPYFNEAAGGKGGGDRILIDSNIDWGQDLGRLAPYLRSRNLTGPVDLAYFGHVDPALYGIDWRPAPMAPPAPGVHRPLTIVSVNFVHGHAYALDYARPPVPVPPNAYRWLEAYTPVDRVGGSLLVYELTDERRRR